MHEQQPKRKTNVYAIIYWGLHVLCIVVVPTVTTMAIAALYEADQNNQRFRASGWSGVLCCCAFIACPFMLAIVAASFFNIIDELKKRMEGK